MSRDDLILVDMDDVEIGFKEKVACHVGRGFLHRAFSVFIFNSNGELLIQKRAAGKMLWPGFWSNSCCSHPRRGEDIENAVARRLVEECGIACDVEYAYKFCYSAEFDGGSENEVCSVFIGRCDDKVVVDCDEISEFKWIGISDLLEDIETRTNDYTPWFKMEIEGLRKRNLI